MSTFDRVKKIIVDILSVSDQDVTMESSLIDDLCVDSLDWVEVSMAVEDEFGMQIPEKISMNWVTVADIVRTIDASTS